MPPLNANIASFNLMQYCTAPTVMTSLDSMGSAIVSGSVYRLPVESKDNFVPSVNKQLSAFSGSGFRSPLSIQSSQPKHITKLPIAQEQLKDWISLSRGSADAQQAMAEALAELKNLYLGTERRFGVLEKDYIPVITLEEHQAEFERLKTQFAIIKTDLQRQGRFPDAIEIKAEHKRLRILYYRLRDLAVAISHNRRLDEDGEEIAPPKPVSPHKKPRSTQKNNKERMFNVGDKLPALVNRPNPMALGMTMRRHQAAAVKRIKEEIETAEVNPEFTLDDMVVGMPTGSGKTRVMAGVIAMGLQEGWIRWQEGDKIIISTHRKAITEQNIKAITKALAPFFKKLTGRDLKVSSYTGTKKDLSGDVVVVSISSAKDNPNNSFYKKLKNELGNAKLAMLLMDEVHHEEAKTWQSFKGRLLSINGAEKKAPIVLGFTGTPTEGMKERIVYSGDLTQYMKEGILPESEIVIGKTDIVLRGLKKSSVSDFVEAHLSKSVNTPSRNKKVMSLMAEHLIKKEDDRGFETTLVFGVDKKHIDDLAKAHVAAFGLPEEKEIEFQLSKLKRTNPYATRQDAIQQIRQERFEGNNLYCRNIVKIDNTCSYDRVREIIQQKELGLIDAIVVVVDGDTRNRNLKIILTAAEKGFIEAVYSCQKLEEGFDAYWAQNLVGARPSLSLIRRAQEAGRIFRRGQDEVSEAGELLIHKQRRLLDIIDSIPDYNIIEYREVLGMRHMLLEEGVVYHLGLQVPIDEIEKKKAKVKRKDRQSKARINRTETESQNTKLNIQSRLLEIYHEVYHDNNVLMAKDLGISTEELEDLLTQPDLTLTAHEIREMEILLYLPMGEILKGVSTASTQETDMFVQQTLLRSLQFYLGQKALSWESHKIPFIAGAENLVMKLTANALQELFYLNTVRSKVVTDLAQALYYMFSKEALEATTVLEKEIWHNERAVLVQGLNAYVSRTDEAGSLLGQMAWDKSVQGIIEQSLSLTEKERTDFINNWFLAIHKDATETPCELFIVGGSGGILKNGNISKGLTLLTKEEYEVWNNETKNPDRCPKIHIVKNNDVWVVGVGNDEVIGTDAVTKILPALLEAKFIFESSEREFARLTKIEPENIQANPRRLSENLVFNAVDFGS